MAKQWPKTSFLVFSACKDPAREGEFNTWYDTVHIPDVLKVPGIAGAQRYKNLRPGDDALLLPPYMAVYEIDGPEPLKVIRQLLATLPELDKAGRMIDCLEVKFAGTLEAVGEQQFAPTCPAAERAAAGWPEAVLLVFTACTDAAREGHFNAWYDAVLVPDLLQMPGMLAGQRYKNLRPGEGGQLLPAYLALYQVEQEEPLKAIRSLLAALPARQKSDRWHDCIAIKRGGTFVAMG